MKTKSVLNAIASALVARNNCIVSSNGEWQSKHEDTLSHIESRFLPSGSGIDCGTKIDLDRSNGHGWIVLTFSYHHMNENGMYDGWTKHEAKITPDLLFGYKIKISGRDRNQIKEYLHDVLTAALDADYVPDAVIA